MKTLKKNLVVGLFSIIAVYLFFLSRSGWDPMHAWNRAFADVSLLLLLLTLVIGPLGKINRFFISYRPWRRELGIWSALTAIIHVYILFDGWFQWEPIRTIAGFDPGTGQLFFDSGFTLANLLGLIGLVYVFLLALISNNKSVKLLGKPAWDYVQQKSSILYILVVAHTAYFLFFYRIGNANWFQKPFLVFVIILFLLQWGVFFLTVLRNRAKARKALVNQD